jgi:pantoate--beta-alanine ligase
MSVSPLPGRRKPKELTIVRSVEELRARILAWRRSGDTIGLVPTMGGLHEGHLTLARRSRAECLRTIATLFVNPTQFGPREDLSAYPRDEETDRAMLASVGVDLLFAPGVEEMYPPGFATQVTVSGLTEHLCGPFRPGHFAGVATVVTKLLLQSLPDAAYFGEKDFQQLQVIRRFVRDLDIPVRITGVPTVRDRDGLALSSRNRYLAAPERAVAGHLPRILADLAQRLADGRPAAPELSAAREALLKAGFTRIDYVELADSETLQPIERFRPPARVFAAAHIGGTRLIDNMPVTRKGS